MFSFLKPKPKPDDFEALRACRCICDLAERTFGYSTGSPERDAQLIEKRLIRLETALLDIIMQQTPGANATVKRMANIAFAALEK